MKACPVWLVWICLLLPSLSPAQHLNGNFPDWGKVSMDDVNITECSFDKNAEALLLLDLGQIFLDKKSVGTQLVTTAFYQRWKVLTEKGTQNANIKISYRPANKCEITHIRATCYNAEDGKLIKIKLDPDKVMNSKKNEYQSEVTFSIPGVKKGSVFEIEYQKSELLNSVLPTWYFSTTVPTLVSSLTVGFVDALDYYVDKHILTSKYKETAADYKYFMNTELTGKAITYTVIDQPADKQEDFVSSPINYKNWIGFQLRKVGPPLNNTYMSQVLNASLLNSYDRLTNYIYSNHNFAIDLESESISKRAWETLIKAGMSDRQKMEALYDFIRSNIAVSGTTGFVPTQGNNSTWKNKTGSTTDINMLLLSTLIKAGLDATPMLVGSRDLGYMNKAYPIFDKFKDIVVLVELDSGEKVILNAADKFLPAGLTPYSLLNTSGLVLKAKDDSYWYDIHEQSPNTNNVLISAVMDDNLTIKGEISISDNNYYAAQANMYKAYGKDNINAEYVKKYVPGITIESVTDTFVAATGKFTHKILFSAQPVTDNDGYVYISIPSIYGNPINPFSSLQRSSNIDFGYQKRQNIVMNLAIPTGYTVDSILKPIRLITPDTSIFFSYQATSSDGSIALVQKIQYGKSFYKLIDYPMIYDFHQQYYDLRQRPVILKKKT